MSGIRNARIRNSGALGARPGARLGAAAAAAVLAALSLSACSGGTGVKDEGASTDASVTASSATGAPAATPSASQAASGSSAGRRAGSHPATPDASRPAAETAAEPPSSHRGAVTCQGSNTKTVASPVRRPLNHLLITVTNTGDRPCYLYTYPSLRFGDAQAEPPAIEDSIPQAVVTLDPGRSGYAAAILSAGDGSGTNGRTEKSLTVYFHGRSGNESVGTGAHPPLPAKGVHIDDSLKTTYWQQSMGDALDW
ncbi:DUF4232 domain-containing protein [Streptomyces sp. NRRL F-5126]|uniref:DUF4232 domain-containing protein n=1 Tax=Streptomyces sp. NRRL F-5126 TaxID=1463857 RepID=UPI0004C93394|nr:DUF4232 domain-containing protein [Streptomyces sp. NRRL F-5126]